MKVVKGKKMYPNDLQSALNHAQYEAANGLSFSGQFYGESYELFAARQNEFNFHQGS